MQQRRTQKLSLKILKAVESAGGRIPKRLLQQRFWRHPAQTFNRVLGELLGSGILEMANGLVLKPVTHATERSQEGCVE